MRVCSKIAKLGLACAMLTLSTASPASESTGGQVTSFYMMANGTILFYVSGPRTAQPTCSTTNRWAVNTTTAAGQAKLASILTAFGQSKTIAIHGTGTCVSWADTEEVEFIFVGQ